MVVIKMYDCVPIKYEWMGVIVEHSIGCKDIMHWIIFIIRHRRKSGRSR